MIAAAPTWWRIMLRCDAAAVSSFGKAAGGHHRAHAAQQSPVRCFILPDPAVPLESSPIQQYYFTIPCCVDARRCSCYVSAHCPLLPSRPYAR